MKKIEEGKELLNKQRGKWLVHLKKNWQLYLLLLIPMVYIFVFKYSPMENILIAMKEYKIGKSVWEMPWASDHGMKYFIKAFKNKDFLVALKNTIFLNLLDLAAGFPAPIIFALILNELPFKKFKKTVQTIAYMPHFISWVIISSLCLQLFAPTNGLVNMVITSLGGEAIPFLNDPDLWVVTYVMSGVWQSFGWGSIIYLAAIAGINPELYEAASVDGAGRFKKMWHITLPGIKSTIVILLIMNLGNILGGGFDRPYAMQNNLVMSAAEVIPTFVYKYGIKSLQFSLTTAVGLFQSVVCLIFLLLANWVSRRLGERGIW